MAKASASASSGGARKKKTTEKFYGKMVPTTSVGGGRVKAPTRASAARARTMVGAVLPGGAVLKGAMVGAKAVRASASMGTKMTKNGTVIINDRGALKNVADNVATRAKINASKVKSGAKGLRADARKKLISNTTAVPTRGKRSSVAVKAKGDTRPIKIDSGASFKERNFMKNYTPLTKKTVKQRNKATLQKLKNSGAIKRMK